MFQSWYNLTFLHWRYDPKIVQPLLPPGLKVDTFDQAAWVGLTPFYLTNLHPLFFPALPWISHFPETNLRTYVLDPYGRRGIWFFSLESARLLAVLGARLTYCLPYHWASMRVIREIDHLHYQSIRKWPGSRDAMTDITVRIEQPFTPEELETFDHFLTARWRLYTVFGKQLVVAKVEHAPWPLMRAEILKLDQNLTTAAGLPLPQSQVLVHYSPGVDVRVSRPMLVRTI
jgi:uncharacterized protein